jgi:CcmD family protein
MNKLKYIFFAVLLLIQSLPLSAQAKVEMADTMRTEGKIYVVVAIIAIVLFGLFFYLLLLDRKVKKLENLLREKQAQTK